MKTEHRGAGESASAPVQTMLASVNWQAVQKTVLEIQHRLTKAIARNELCQIRIHQHLLRLSYSAKALAKRQPSSSKGNADWIIPVSTMLERAEPLATVSLTHLCKTTRRKLELDALSVASYPNRYGGFVFVGGDASDMPEEADLFAVAEVARLANLEWLKFDRDGAVVPGLPVFTD